MHCEDNGKLRTPLNEVCMTTDIGCVPIVNGQPTCKPQPDELPIAYDKTTSTLWLFSCDTREWVAHKKFTMEELQDLNLENLNNICSILKIGVFYNPGTGTIQGNVSLGEFAEQLLKCLDLETKVVTVTQGENNTIKISIEGLDGLPPTYVKGDNVWFTGTGTEGDPIIVHTYDPICKWPIASQSAVDAATTKHLGACLDGQPSRVPYPPKPCEYPQKTQEEVDAAASKNLIACVDGEAVKVPYPKYQPPVCEADQLTLEQASAAGSNLTLLGCEDNSVVRIPVSGSGFFDRDYICVPTVTAAPTDAPLSGTGPLRIGCNGELYVWICSSEGTGRWEEVRYNMNSLASLNPDNVTDLCNNFRMMGWYSNTEGDPCVEQVKFTLYQLNDLLKKCDNFDEIKVIADSIFYKHCLKLILNSPLGNDPLIYRSRDNRVITSADKVSSQAIEYYGTPMYLTINVVNDFTTDGLLMIDVHGLFNTVSTDNNNKNISLDMVLSDKLEIDFRHTLYENSEGIITTPSFINYDMVNGDNIGEFEHVFRRAAGGNLASLIEIIPKGSNKTFYIQYYLIFEAGGMYTGSVDIRCKVDAVLYPIKGV